MGATYDDKIRKVSPKVNFFLRSEFGGRRRVIAVSVGGVAAVNLRLRGGPCDGETTTIDVQDANNPPELYAASIHGPHGAMGRGQYRRVGREPDSGAGAGTWTYETSGEAYWPSA